MLASIFWDPAREVFSFHLPFLERPILWYGVFFALGFLLGYFILVYLLHQYFLQREKKGAKEYAKKMGEKALFYAILGTLIGARLADVLFYQDWVDITKNPFSIFAFWEGGLASHGGVLGALIALFFWVKNQKNFLSFLGFLDFVCIPSMVIAGFIRIGNFFNQEILGTCTSLPFAVIFGHPADRSFPCPRHPVQLYESFFYFLLAFLLGFWRKKMGEGRVVGLFLIILFTFRFFIEYFKMEQSVWVEGGIFTMGQILSIPFVLLGLFFFFKRKI